MEIEEQFEGKESEPQTKKPEMTELIKAHLDEVAGGLADHSSWMATKNCVG
jgi:hypothetical protein